MFAVFTFGYSLYTFFRVTQENDLQDALEVSWSEFVNNMLMKGEVSEVIIKPGEGRAIVVLNDGAIIKGRRPLHEKYIMSLPDTDHLEEKIRTVENSYGIRPDQRIQVNYDRDEVMSDITKLILMCGVLYIVYLLYKRTWMPFNDFFSQMSAAKFTLVDPLLGGGKGVRFDDVAGLKEAKVEVMEFVDYLKQPERYKTLGAKVPKGALLLGPPGCGKTLLAKAVATEANVPFLSMNGSEFIEMIGGLGAARVRSLFAEARKRSPSILYIDEIDAIGKKRSESDSRMNSESSQTLIQLLVELDGMKSKEGVILLASTNMAEVLDKALLRPGRFDRHILIDLPTLDERRQIFEQHLKKIVLQHSPSTYSSKLAFLTPGFTGADIANICNEAALHAARVCKKMVDIEDLNYAIDRVIGGAEKKHHAMSESEKSVVAFHESGHALVAWLLEHTKALIKVTIVPRTNLALGFARYVPQEKKLLTKDELFENMCVMLGGRVAESLTFNRITTGAQNDLEKVTKLAYAQVQQYGMSPNVGMISFHPESLDTQTRKPFSKTLQRLMDEEVKRMITEAYKKTETLLLKNKDKLGKLAEALLRQETLSYKDVENLIGPPPFGNKDFIDPATLEAPIEDTSKHSSTGSPEPNPSPQ
ncbi:mitochondrial inner membrane m-AAA protease component paraplegin isoform X2 [Prorops nasuta]